jgi:hypothetical protein
MAPSSFDARARRVVDTWFRGYTSRDRLYELVRAEILWAFGGAVAAQMDAALLRAAITEHHAQKADDRCVEDDDRLYAAAGLPPCDRRVGDKAAMLENCRRFVERRCEGGGWPTYAELEAEVDALRRKLCELADHVQTVSGTFTLSDGTVLAVRQIQVKDMPGFTFDPEEA